MKILDLPSPIQHHHQHNPTYLVTFWSEVSSSVWTLFSFPGAGDSHKRQNTAFQSKADVLQKY